MADPDSPKPGADASPPTDLPGESAQSTPVTLIEPEPDPKPKGGPKARPNPKPQAGAEAGSGLEYLADLDPVPSLAPVADPEPAPKSAPQAAAQPAPPPPAPRRSGLFGLVLGGALAAAAGFGAAQYVPQGWPIMAADTSALEAGLAAQTAEIAGLKAEIERLDARPPVVDPALADRLSALEAAVAALPAPAEPAPAPDLAPLTDRLSALEARLTAFEAMPAGEAGGVSPAALAGLQQQIEALKADLAAQAGTGASLSAELESMVAASKAQLAEAEARAGQMTAEAEAVARRATLGAALGRVQAALDSGAPFGAAIADLQAAGLEVPPVLAEGAAGGLPTVNSLQASFPEAARAALDASLRATVGESAFDRFTGFVRTQTGARSLTPREGTDPDAVLSRAEAALRAGALPEALAELAALPAEGQAALADWVAQAQRRLQAVEAVTALTATVDAG